MEPKLGILKIQENTDCSGGKHVDDSEYIGTTCFFVDLITKLKIIQQWWRIYW